MVWSLFETVNHFGRGPIAQLQSAGDFIRHTASAGAHLIRDDVSAALHSIKSSALGTVRLVQDDVHAVAQGLSSAASSGVALIHSGAQAGVDAFNQVGFPSVIAGLGQNLVADTNLPGILSNAATPLVTGLGGILATVAAVIGLGILLKS